MNIMYLAAGVLLLLLGRKLFWLFVAIIGFLLGITFIPQILPDQTQSVILTISLVAGLLGALLTVLLQKFAVGLAGLAAGGYIAYYLLQISSFNAGEYQWLAILAGALLGAVLSGSMYDWALILITSACGAVLVSEGIGVEAYILLLVLVLVGIIVQGNIKAKE